MSAREALAAAYLEEPLSRLSPEGQQIVLKRIDQMIAVLSAAGYVIAPKEQG